MIKGLKEIISKYIINRMSESKNKIERLRDFCFTDWNKEGMEFDKKKMVYMCRSPEVTKSGKHHWQSYVYWKDACTLSACNKRLSKGRDVKVACLKAEGSAAQNAIYCGKEDYIKEGKVKLKNDKFVEFGEMPKQGKRTDLNELIEKIKVGETSSDNVCLDQPHMYHLYGRTLMKAEEICMSKKWRTKMTKGYWIFGETGVGKSHIAYKNFHPDTHYSVPADDNGYWENYRQQDIVIFNDFRGWLKYEELLRLVDKWPMEVKRRGRTPMPFTSKVVIITSSSQPESIYCRRQEEDQMDQFHRRFQIMHRSTQGNIGLSCVELEFEKKINYLSVFKYLQHTDQ